MQVSTKEHIKNNNSDISKFTIHSHNHMHTVFFDQPFFQCYSRFIQNCKQDLYGAHAAGG